MREGSVLQVSDASRNRGIYIPFFRQRLRARAILPGIMDRLARCQCVAYRLGPQSLLNEPMTG